MQTFEIEPRGPFSLDAARTFAGGFAAGIGGGEPSGVGLTMAFPIEGWQGSAAVDVRQLPSGIVEARFDGSDDIHAVRRQVARCLSLDHDGTGWPAVGERDAIIGRLQTTHDHLRPVCFYSAYEAATSFVIGDHVSIDGTTYAAFPRPQRLLELGQAPGLNQEKVTRLHGLAEAALDGRLDTERLRSLPTDDALAELMQLRGVGAFTAEGTLLRGCGLVDVLPGDPLSRDVIGDVYGLGGPPDDEEAARITDRWRPYRMWATVLLRVGWERSSPGRSYRKRPTQGR